MRAGTCWIRALAHIGPLTLPIVQGMLARRRTTLIFFIFTRFPRQVSIFTCFMIFTLPGVNFVFSHSRRGFSWFSRYKMWFYTFFTLFTVQDVNFHAFCDFRASQCEWSRVHDRWCEFWWFSRLQMWIFKFFAFSHSGGVKFHVFHDFHAPWCGVSCFHVFTGPNPFSRPNPLFKAKWLKRPPALFFKSKWLPRIEANGWILIAVAASATFNVVSLRRMWGNLLPPGQLAGWNQTFDMNQQHYSASFWNNLHCEWPRYKAKTSPTRALNRVVFQMSSPTWRKSQ